MEMPLKKYKMVLMGFMLVGILAVGLGPTPVCGQPRTGMDWRGMMGDGPGMLLPVVLKGVHLTTDQEGRVHQIMAAHRATFRTLFSQLRGTQEELADKLYGPGEVQATELTPQIERVNRLREQLLGEGIKIALEVREILTPEQRVKATHIKDRMRALRAEMRSLLTEPE